MPEETDMRIRMTGCPNGCARPYMAELALVGDGPEMYQIWVGGTSNLTRLAEPLESKIKWLNMRQYLTTLFTQWKHNRLNKDEAFGDFAARIGVLRLREGQKVAESIDEDTVWSI